MRPLKLLLLALTCASLFTSPTSAQDDTAPATDSTDTPKQAAFPLASLLGLANGLEINPQVITDTSGGNTTVGIQYKYERALTNYPLYDATALEIKLRSEGLVVADEDDSPHRLLTHGLRLSAIDLFPPRVADPDNSDETRQLIDQIDRRRHNWVRALERIDELKAKPDRTSADEAELDEQRALARRTVAETRPLLADYGVLVVDEKTQNWKLKNADGKIHAVSKALRDRLYKPRALFLCVDVDVDAETDQTFSDVQFVGSAQLSGKLHWEVLDFPFALLRGGPAKNWRNRGGGPFFYAGIAAVDASENESRLALAPGEDQYARAQAGVSYRTEVFSWTAEKSVALELAWRYFHEFGAPAALRTANLDRTSYFKATLLFPGNYFIEYTDGKLPLDTESSSTASVGWRFYF